MIANGQFCSKKNAKNIVIESKKDLIKLKSETGINIEETDTMNFDQKLLIAVFRGGCPSGGYNIHIKDITVNNNELLINVICTNPGNNCRKTMALTQPYAIYIVKRTKLNICFSESIVVNDCDNH